MQPPFATLHKASTGAAQTLDEVKPSSFQELTQMEWEYLDQKNTSYSATVHCPCSPLG